MLRNACGSHVNILGEHTSHSKTRKAARRAARPTSKHSWRQVLNARAFNLGFLGEKGGGIALLWFLQKSGKNEVLAAAFFKGKSRLEALRGYQVRRSIAARARGRAELLPSQFISLNE